jgi:membrane protein DedA with SNARE-associated domain
MRGRVVKIERHFGKHTGKTLIVGKMSHGVGGAILVAAGMAKIPFWKYVWFNTLASIPKSLGLLIIGYYFGHAYNQIDHYFTYAALGMLGIAILTAVMYTVIHKLGTKYES